MFFIGDVGNFVITFQNFEIQLPKFVDVYDKVRITQSQSINYIIALN